MRTMMLVLTLVLSAAGPAHATPVTFDTPAILRAPACKIGWVFGAPLVAPPCLSPLFVEITLPAGDPTSLWGTLAYYPGGFTSHQSVGLSQDRRVTEGGFERFALPTDLVDGDYYFALSLSHIERNELILYLFRLEWPAKSSPGGPSPVESTPPLEATPEPATLLLFGTTVAGLGLARWLKRRRAVSTSTTCR